MKNFTLRYVKTGFLVWILIGVSLIIHMFTLGATAAFLCGAAAAGIAAGGSLVALIDNEDTSDGVFLWGLSMMGFLCATYPDNINAGVTTGAMVTIVLLGVWATKRFNLMGEKPETATVADETTATD